MGRIAPFLGDARYSYSWGQVPFRPGVGRRPMADVMGCSLSCPALSFSPPAARGEGVARAGLRILPAVALALGCVCPTSAVDFRVCNLDCDSAAGFMPLAATTRGLLVPTSGAVRPPPLAEGPTSSCGRHLCCLSLLRAEQPIGGAARCVHFRPTPKGTASGGGERRRTLLEASAQWRASTTCKINNTLRLSPSRSAVLCSRNVRSHHPQCRQG